MAQLLTKGIREALRDAAALDPEHPKRGDSEIRTKAIDAVIGHAKLVHPEMFRDDVDAKV